MTNIQGTFVALVTPMHSDESINFDELANQVTRHTEAGIDWIFCLGTNGEFYALTFEEKLAVTKAVVAAAGNKVKVCAGVGCITTDETKRLAAEITDLGVQAVSVITPYFVSVSQTELVEHYREVASTTELPVILYNIPGRTGNAIAPGVIKDLEAERNVVAIKDSSGNFENVRSYVETAATLSRDFAVLVGTDSLILAGLEIGTAGCVSGLANIAPEIVVDICGSFRAGNLENAKTAQERLVGIRSMLSRGNSNSITKRATVLIGQPVGPARKPVSGVDPGLDVEIKEILAKYGLL